jgi:hypothetical protein
LDFGIAKFLGAGVATTQRDLLHGTILYMSPEHLQGLRVTVRSDIYALGTTLYEALAGSPPCLIGMEEPTLESVTFAQLSRMPLTLDVLTGSVPRFVARTIQRMLAKAPADRFATMAEVAQVLRGNLQRLAREVPSSTAPPRKLWLGTNSISPTSGAIRLGDAMTDVRELAPITAPFSESSSQQRNTATPLQFPFAAAIRTEVTAPIPKQNAATVAPATLPPAPGQAIALQTEGLEPPLSPARTPLTLPQFLLCGVALGTLIGVLVALVQAFPRPAAPAASKNAAAFQANIAKPTSPTALPSASVSVARVASSQPVAATPSAATAAKPVRLAPRPQTAPRSVSKPVSAGPASGLLGDTNSEPKAKTNAVATPARPIASSIRRPKAIYGSDDGAE